MLIEQTQEKDEILAGMLKENTGKHMLDSGDHYGRHWERNQERDFAEESPLEVEVRKYEETIDIIPSLKTFHFLRESLYLDDEARELHKNQGIRNLGEAEQFALEEAKKRYPGSSARHHIITENTYNAESMLEQHIQYVLVFGDDIYNHDFVILQTHNGCDIRGGYSRPHVFKVADIARFISGHKNLIATVPELMLRGFSDDAGYTFYEDIDFEEPEKYEVGGDEIYFLAGGSRFKIYFHPCI